MRDLEKILYALLAAEKRLARADTDRKRKNARKHFFGLLRRARNAAVGAGARKPSVRCPYCKVPITGWSGLAKHLYVNHGWHAQTHAGIQCPCGSDSGRGMPFARGFKRVGLHLAGQADLAAHVNLAKVAGTTANGSTP